MRRSLGKAATNMVMLVTLGAGVGAVMQYVLTQLGKNWWPGVPLATLVINSSGAFLAGFLAMCALQQAWSLLLLTGVWWVHDFFHIHD